MKIYKSVFKLIDELKQFNPSRTINNYQRNDLKNKSPIDIMEFSFGNNICRAFPKETPKKRFRNWSWYKRPRDILENIDFINYQEDYDKFIYHLGDSLVEEWGKENDIGEQSRMNRGVSMKIINLIMKHMSYSQHNLNDKVKEFLHVPWDMYTLSPIRLIFNREMDYRIPSTLRMGFVKNREVYDILHQYISEICLDDAKVRRINYEFLIWDTQHQ